jgi:outer membrane protein OmpA-like peptidoglycan-associated protein
MSRWVTALAMGALLAFPARAQFGGLLDKAVRKGSEAAEKAAKQKPAPQAAPPAEAPPEKAAGKAAGGAPAETAAPPLAPAEPKEPEVYAHEFDFVPGDRVIFFEDLSDTDVGDYPVRWTRKDGGGGQAVEVVEKGSRHWLRMAGSQRGWSIDYLRSTFQDLPQKFTLELDAYIDSGWLQLYTDRGRQIEVSRDEARSGSAHSAYAAPKGLKRVSISVNDTYVKIYVNGKRVLVDADGLTRPIKKLGIGFHYPDKDVPLMFTALRLAEGGKDYRKELVSLGRIVTHGITFDSGSDVVKPESGPTLRNILKLLQEDADLRFEVQGHTDSQGSPKVNGPLSERRAAAVRTWLVSQGVDGKRLTATGLGDTKPIDTNDTPEGRANNRRVEFVKL